MKVSELVNLLKKKCGDEDFEIDFFAYRWNDDLENKGDNPAWLNRISRHKGRIQIFFDT